MPTRLLKKLKIDTETKFHTLQTSDGPIMVPYFIRRSKRARRITVRLDAQNQALVTVPNRASVKAALEFLDQCGDWLLDQMSKTPRPKSILEYLLDKPTLTLNGIKCRLAFAFTNRCPYFEYKREEEEVVLRYDPHNIHEARIRETLKKLAKLCLTERLNFLCAEKNINPPSRVTVRDQSSRWGSCSHSRSISLNWRLILLTIGMQDYVILHELAHLKEMNHSRDFWSVLNSYDSRSKIHDRRLNTVGLSIISLGQSV